MKVILYTDWDGIDLWMKGDWFTASLRPTDVFFFQVVVNPEDILDQPYMDGDILKVDVAGKAL